MYFCTKNAMALGTVTVTGADANNPKERLYDRDRNDLWVYTATGAITFDVDIGSNTTIDLLVIDGHNFDGETIEWERYDSGSWTDIVSSWVQSGNGQIVKVASSPVTDTRFRVTVTSMTDPECAEITMSERKLNISPNWNMSPGYSRNQAINYSRTGHRWALKLGEEKWQARYSLTLNEADSELTEWLTCLADIDYGLHAFYVYDYEDILRFVELQMPVTQPFAFKNDDFYALDITLTEVH